MHIKDGWCVEYYREQYHLGDGDRIGIFCDRHKDQGVKVLRQVAWWMGGLGCRYCNPKSPRPVPKDIEGLAMMMRM